MTDYVVDKSVVDLKEGEFISTGFRFTDVSSGGGQVSIVLENDSDYDLWVPSLSLRSQFRGRVEKGFNASIDTSDSNLGFNNKKSSGTNNSSGINVFTAGDGQTGGVTLDGDNFNDKHLAAGKATSPGTRAEVGGNIVAPGDNLVVRAVNESSTNGAVSIDLDFIKMNNGP